MWNITNSLIFLTIHIGIFSPCSQILLHLMLESRPASRKKSQQNVRTKNISGYGQRFKNSSWYKCAHFVTWESNMYCMPGKGKAKVQKAMEDDLLWLSKTSRNIPLRESTKSYIHFLTQTPNIFCPYLYPQIKAERTVENWKGSHFFLDL